MLKKNSTMEGNMEAGEKPKILKRHQSMLDFKKNGTNGLNACRRRISFDVTNLKRLSISEDAPKPLKIDPVLKEDEDLVKLPELVGIPPTIMKQTQRRYTVITTPAQLHAPKLKPIKKQRSQPLLGTHFSPLPCIKSSSDLKNCHTDEPQDDLDVARDFDESGVFVPKPCWCMRCQIMLSMFNTGDKQLEKWGNYPCFRR